MSIYIYIYIYIFILAMLVGTILTFISNNGKRPNLRRVKLFYDAEDRGIALYIVLTIFSTVALFWLVLMR